MKGMTDEALKGFWKDVQEMLEEAVGDFRNLLLLQRDAIKQKAFNRGFDRDTVYEW